eukprot:3772520-Prymnesium_polylepis.1
MCAACGARQSGRAGRAGGRAADTEEMLGGVAPKSPESETLAFIAHSDDAPSGCSVIPLPGLQRTEMAPTTGAAEPAGVVSVSRYVVPAVFHAPEKSPRLRSNPPAEKMNCG